MEKQKAIRMQLCSDLLFARTIAKKINPPTKSNIKMTISVVLLIIAIGIRFVLDIVGILRKDIRIDWMYAILFLIIGLFFIVEEPVGFMGYIFIIFFILYGVYSLKKK
jgi:hypothetical protein